MLWLLPLIYRKMGDTRVHPTTVDTDPPPPPSANYSGDHPKPQHLPPSKPIPPPPAYVVQFPREQILRYPPPENATKFQALTRRRHRRSCCRRCCCLTLSALLLLAVAAAISAGTLYLVFRFKSPEYTVTNLTIRGMNMTSVALVSPEFDVTIRAENPNGKIGIYYLRGSSVNVFFNGVKLSGGALPAFYQPRRNVTVLRAALTGSDIVLGGAVRTALRNAQNQRRVPFVVRTEVPVKIKVGSVTTWKITVKVNCDVEVDGMNERANILSKDCDYSVRLW